MLNKELRLFAALAGVGSGVSSLSAAFSGDDMFSAPEEKSRSNFRGVMKAGWLKTEGLGVAGGCEKRKGCELGSRRAGRDFFSGESKALCGPGIVSLYVENRAL